MKKEKSLTRDQVAELYSDLKKTMNQLEGKNKGASSLSKEDKEVAKQIAAAIKQGMAADLKEDFNAAMAGLKESNQIEVKNRKANLLSDAELPFYKQLTKSNNIRSNKKTISYGSMLALSLVLFFGAVNVVVSAIEVSGIFKAKSAEATYIGAKSKRSFNLYLNQRFSPEEVKLLKELDSERAKIAQKKKELQSMEQALRYQKTELTTKLAELNELTSKLAKKHNLENRKQLEQLKQLANVYGSMKPEESAMLMEQLDITIALNLLKRMPEKRIGQILSLMSREKALQLTKMLGSIN